ncbi:MAG: cysteine methyltransferase [Flavobacterium sp. BFFFF2]|nr:MAG: cysteine methyltransferase [Flavobacterium sp. BFFFF2]
MSDQQSLNYKRIATALDYIQDHFLTQPNLDEVAEKVHLSPFHFQRLFSDWAGTSPKRFLQFTTLSYAKSLLKEQQASLFDVAHQAGLSGTSRLHDLFVSMEAMTPAEYKNGGKNLVINYHFTETPFGTILIASTSKGVCHLAFIDDTQNAFLDLQIQYPNALFKNTTDDFQQQALQIFGHEGAPLSQMKLHLKGSPFQLKVWQALLKIPMGQLNTYKNIAEAIEKPTASRAVGTAIGSNPIAFLIPCHRVIQSSGLLGGYRWGTTRKTAIIGWEGVKTQPE